MVTPSTSNKPIKVFDAEARKRASRRAAACDGDFDFLRKHALANIEDRQKDITRSFDKVLRLTPVHWDNEIEAIDADGKDFDLISSVLDMHVVNDLPGLLLQIRRSLKPDGLFLGAMFGGETLYQLRETLTQTELMLKDGTSPRVFPFADKQQMGALLQRAGFALPVIDSEIVTVTYDNLFKLMQDLRGMGETNVIAERSRANPGKEFFMRAADYYQQKFSDADGRIEAAFEIIYLIGWSPDASQQQPLRPGSAETRLADALNTDEIKMGEKP